MFSSRIDDDPHHVLLEELGSLVPHRTLLRPALLHASLLPGEHLIVFRVFRGQRLLAFAAGRERASWGAKVLTFDTLPVVLAADQGAQDRLAEAVVGYARRKRVFEVNLHSFDSDPVSIPRLGRLCTCRRRREYWMDLTVPEKARFRSMSRNHRENLRRARSAGLVFERSLDPRHIDEHVRLRVASMQRRAARGEEVPIPRRTDADDRLLQSGCAWFARVLLGDACVASYLICEGETSAYCYSAGSSGEGKRHGACHFAICRAMADLAGRGKTRLNLGGVGDADSAGLERFKAGFGARAVALEDQCFATGGPIGSRLYCAARLTLRNPRHAARTAVASMVQHTSRYVYRCEPGECVAADPPPNVSFEAVDAATLRQAAATWDAFALQPTYLERYGVCRAWGLWVQRELAHMCWVLGRDEHALVEPPQLALRSGECQIAHCVTVQRYKRMGLEEFAIVTLSRKLFDAGMRRVYITANDRDLALQGAIAKAGLKRVGSVHVAEVPALRLRWLWRDVPGMHATPGGSRWAPAVY